MAGVSSVLRSVLLRSDNEGSSPKLARYRSLVEESSEKPGKFVSPRLNKRCAFGDHTYFRMLVDIEY
jgi:hypothetical protein